MRLRVGQSWDALEIVDIETVLISYALANDGRGGLKSENQPVQKVTLECKCGERMELYLQDIPSPDYPKFPGRNRIHDCGCGAGSKYHEISYAVHSTISASMPQPLAERLLDFAKRYHLTRSKAICVLVETGLKAAEKQAGLFDASRSGL